MFWNVLTPWRSPVQSLESCRREMDELFNRFWGNWQRVGAPMRMSGALLHVESGRQGTAFGIQAELSGVDSQAVEGIVHGHQLTICREPRAQQDGKRVSASMWGWNRRSPPAS